MGTNSNITYFHTDIIPWFNMNTYENEVIAKLDESDIEYYYRDK